MNKTTMPEKNDKTMSKTTMNKTINETIMTKRQ